MRRTLSSPPRAGPPGLPDLRRAGRPARDRRGAGRGRHHPGVRDPGVRAADRAARHRPDRPGAHRHRQDARLRRAAAGPGRSPPSEGADGSPQALVVVPTRELGLQVARDIAAAGKTRGVRVLPVYGGVAYEPQVEALKQGVEIIVGTPGRLLDLPGEGQAAADLRLDRVRALVLDEADRMLDLGFLDDVEKILAMLPEERQTMLFSATMPDPIVTLARRFLRQPVTIHAAPRRRDRPVAADQAGRLPHPPAEQGRGRGPDPAGRGARADDDLHAGPSGPPTGSPRTSTSAASRSPRSTATWARAPASGRCGRSATARSTCWSPPTWPPAAWTSPASPT